MGIERRLSTLLERDLCTLSGSPWQKCSKVLSFFDTTNLSVVSAEVIERLRDMMFVDSAQSLRILVKNPTQLWRTEMGSRAQMNTRPKLQNFMG